MTRKASGRAIHGSARPGRKTKNLIPALQRGDIAIIDHPDMDGVCAAALAERRVAAVVNASESLTGRYPAAGPGILLSAGIPVFDCAGADLLARLKPGAVLEVRETGEVLLGDECLAVARRVSPALLEQRLAEARGNTAVEMEAFVRNTLSYLTEEWTLLFEERSLPELRTALQGRDVLVVVRGEGYREDLQAIRSYVRDKRPVLIGVDGGADALLEMGLRPDIILGDMDSVSDAALRCGAELIVHGYQKRRPQTAAPAPQAPPELAGEGGGGTADTAAAPGLARVRGLGLDAQVLHAVGTSEDVALILAETKGARLIVVVGSHFSLRDFLDKGRKGMSSTFLARLKVGSILVDAKGVSRLYHRGLRVVDIAWLVLAALVLVFVVLSVSAGARDFVDLIALRAQLWLRHLW